MHSAFLLPIEVLAMFMTVFQTTVRWSNTAACNMGRALLVLEDTGVLVTNPGGKMIIRLPT